MSQLARTLEKKDLNKLWRLSLSLSHDKIVHTDYFGYRQIVNSETAYFESLVDLNFKTNVLHLYHV
jgi:hypothetical protein